MFVHSYTVVYMSDEIYSTGDTQTIYLEQGVKVYENE